MKVGSICSGIGAETLASQPLGWKVKFYAEIGAFPSAVLNHHFPETPNHGDFTQISSADNPGVEIIVGGPPCQSFSIAGNRGGLNDNRGNLTLNYVEMCHDFADNGSLRWAFYENVPGILSDKTNAFGCLISGLVGADDPFTPPDGESWPKCGMASGPRARLAWRVLGAEYFALAQPRPRLFLVVGFADGCDPAKVLFEARHSNDNAGKIKRAGKDISFGLTGNANNSRKIYTLAIRGRKTGFSLEYRDDGLANTLLTPNGGRAGIGVGAIADAGAVRRLTPIECARLQGFPDKWTLIPWRGKPAEQCPDGPQYKAYGNTWAVNCVAWIFARIDAVDRAARELSEAA